jgi:hypothetical protein
MAVKRDSRYPGRWTPADADFPLGGPKNRTTTTSQDGSYFNRDFIADYEAFFQRLMAEGGVTVNETPDTAPTSQFYSALLSAMASNSLQFADMVGFIMPFHMEGSLDGWLDLKGGEYSRTTDAILWAYAQSTGLIIAQATKDADPETYAMYFGDGDGSTTFTLPNHHLGHFLRGTPSGKTHGSTELDAIQNFTASVGLRSMDGGNSMVVAVSGSAAPYSSSTTQSTVSTSADVRPIKGFTIDPSLSVNTDDEVRPLTANLSYKIHRGWK